MGTKIVICQELDYCWQGKGCSFCRSERTIGAGYAFDYFCNKLNGQKIAGYVEYSNDIVPIPKWCPIREDNENSQVDINSNECEHEFIIEVDKERINTSSLTNRSCDWKIYCKKCNYIIRSSTAYTRNSAIQQSELHLRKINSLSNREV